MAKSISFEAEPRERAGKGAARAVRRAGRVPGVIYGDSKPPVLVSLSARDLARNYTSMRFFSTLCELKVGGETYRTLPRDVQTDPVTDVPVHIDFLRVGAGTRVTVSVPLSFSNLEKSAGIKRGGVLNVISRTIDLRCPSDKIPEILGVDASALDVGESIRFSQIVLPKGVELAVKGRDLTMATIVAPSALKSEEKAAATPATAAAVPAEGEAAATAPAEGAEAAKAEGAPAAEEGKKKKA